uniref:DUF6644 domain-containing protein n=1 Tax=Rhodopseudomonas palustris (strain BisA53) TaxID=316055 RepID=Q07ST4_RHOP5
MTDAAPAIFVALEASAIAAAIRQSSWIYMVANIGHIVALALFAGALAVMDLRLAGAFAATAPARVIRGARRAAIAAFLGLALTGAVLFAAEASHVVLNQAFQFKLGLIALGLANVAFVEATIVPKLARQAPLTPLPPGARFGGLASLAIWLGVAICGRAIAYF